LLARAFASAAPRRWRWHQLARRLAGAVGADRPAHPPAAAEKKLPVIAFVEDVAASGGYWLACAADEIIADSASIVGSIGVITRGFGFQDLIARFGDRAARAHLGRAQGDARSISRREARGSRAPEAPAGRDPRRLQGLGAPAPRHALKGDEAALFSASSGPPGAGWSWAWSTAGRAAGVLQARYGAKVHCR
jgi:hypothetical protein